jgi:hypothetical protein
MDCRRDDDAAVANSTLLRRRPLRLRLRLRLGRSARPARLKLARRSPGSAEPRRLLPLSAS